MAFSQGATGLSQLPSCFELILGVTVESVHGSQVYLDCTGTSRSLEMLARPLEFLLSVKLSPPPLEVLQECQDSFPDEAGKWTLLSGRGGKPGIFLICGGSHGDPIEWRQLCRGTF